RIRARHRRRIVYVTTASAMVPLKEGLFEMPETMDGVPRLIGQKCGNCKECVTGADHSTCPNCCQEALERITLSSIGEVYSYTTVHQQLPAALVQAPYVMARINLPEGVIVQTVLTDVEPGQVHIGMQVEVCLRQLGESEGRPI